MAGDGIIADYFRDTYTCSLKQPIEQTIMGRNVHFNTTGNVKGVIEIHKRDSQQRYSHPTEILLEKPQRAVLWLRTQKDLVQTEAKEKR